MLDFIVFFYPLKKAQKSAFSLLEILAVVSIISVLAAMIIPATKKLMPTVERTICISNLKSLRAGFGVYAIDGWPQIPESIPLDSIEEHRWWLEKTEKDLGLSKKAWECPTIRRQLAQVPEKDRPLIHYLPTPFPDGPDRANKWSQMPWFIEIANAHGQGNLLVRQNGVVEPAAQ